MTKPRPERLPTLAKIGTKQDYCCIAFIRCHVILPEIFQEVIMSETAAINFSAFVTGLSPSALTFFRILFENAQTQIKKDGPQTMYEKSLAEFSVNTGCIDMEEASKAIREIIQRKVECKEGEFLYFFPFMTSICIENGIVKYSLPREIENFMLHFPQFDKGRSDATEKSASQNDAKRKRKS
jgi:hypothetical protein